MEKKKLLLLCGLFIVLAIASSYFIFFKDSNTTIGEQTTNRLSEIQEKEIIGANIGAIQTEAQWNVIKSTGYEGDNFKFYSSNLKDKKVQLCWVIKDGIDPASVDKSNRILYNGNGEAILDDKNKKITLKYETAKCNGKDGYNIDLTNAQAININNYVQLGNNTIGVAYQNISMVSYQTDWFELNATLYINIDGDWNNTINDIFVFDYEDKDKFGANVTGFEGTQQFKYIIESDQTIREFRGRYYISNNEEKHNIGLNDICDPRLNDTFISEELGYDGRELFNPNCTFNLENNKLEVEFYAEEFDGIINVDPTITIDDVNSYASVNNNVSTNAYPMAYAALNDPDLAHYYTFDNNHPTTEYDLGHNPFNGDRKSLGEYTTDGVFGNAYRLLTETDEDNIDLGDDDTWDTTNEFTWSAWVNIYEDGPNTYDAIFYKGQYFTPIGITYTGTPYYRIAVRTSNTNYIPATGYTITYGEWDHLVVTYKNNYAVVYVNGQNISDAVTLAGDLNVAGNAYIGGWYEGLNNTGGNFSIDDLMLFDRELTPAEVSAIYQNTSARFNQSATQQFTNVNFTQGGSDNRVNVTYNTTLNFGTTMQLRIREFNGATNTANTSWQSLSNGDNQLNTFNISTTTNNLTLEFNYTTDSNKFYSPVLRDNIVVETWAGGGAVNPNVTFSDYWDDNWTVIDTGDGHFNVTVSDTNGTVILWVEGDNYTASNDTAGDYNMTVAFTNSGVYEYYWYSWNLDGIENTSGNRSYTVRDPPALHTVQGYVFLEDGTTPASNLTNVTINATETGSFVSTNTNGPPGSEHFYSTTISALNNETIIVWAFNNTYYGYNTTVTEFSPSTTYLNITMQENSSAVPSIHTIEGYIFLPDGTTQASLGTNVTINATTTGSFVSTETSGPPGHYGYYSTTISAVDNETVIVTGFNESYYGYNSTQLLASPSTTEFNVTMNTTLTSDSCTYSSGNWDVTCSDNCEITSNVTIDTGANISLIGTGYFKISSGVYIGGWSYAYQDNSCQIIQSNIGGFV